MENEKRLHRCCFTGHRPEKLSLSENEVKHLLEKAIDNVIADGYVTFITGMAKGTDIWAAEIVLEKKKRNDALRLICAIPHPDFEKRRGFFEERRYNRILKNADYVTIISDHYYLSLIHISLATAIPFSISFTVSCSPVSKNIVLPP